MKKFLLTMAVALTAMFATAQTKTYTDALTVDINGEPSEPQETTINVKSNSDGTYCLSLNNFSLGEMINVGNIVLDNILATEEAGIRSFATKQTINITAGDGDADDWMGPMLGDVPVDLKGEMTEGSLYCTIDIDMSALLGQVINVKFGKDIKGTRTYTDALVVTINGQSSAPQQTTINVDEKVDGTYTLSLNDFMLDGMPIGNIVLHDITATDNDGVFSFEKKQNITITSGSDDSVDWGGPMLGEVPVDMTGKMTEYKLYCNINIDMSATLNQVINVKFGNEDVTGIEQIAGEKGEKVIFDLTGRRVEAITAPGIYIVNGKKVIVK
ncbi:MAG: calycin-like domain-containing protein [Bacteroidaceae bacterium]|nr:calycin-like domain-containing protein [Bacteroidaceae bacterium]